jgi:uncharacterized membrane protein HdeD (DUF308 family)
MQVPLAPAQPAPAATPTATGGEEQAVAAAADLAGKAVPWGPGMKWQGVLAEGIVLAVIGAIVWWNPNLGVRTLIDLIGLILLVTAALSAVRVFQDQVAPSQVGVIGFRSGVGVTVGASVVIGSLIADDNVATALAIAVVLGIGLVLYGVAAVLGSWRREAGAPLPIARLIVAALTLLLGLALVWQSRNGIDALDKTFTWLGILVLIVGLILTGYGLVMRSHDTQEPD